MKWIGRRRTEFAAGAVFRVPVRDAEFAYAVMLAEFPYIAFYGQDAAFDDRGAPIGPPMFTVLVERSAYVRGGWGKPIRHLPPEAVPAIPTFFWQSVVNKAECELIEPVKRRRSVSPAECAGFESSAIWADAHLRSRIEDTYEGRPNLFAESLRLKL
jgi:hypothetical protein